MKRLLFVSHCILNTASKVVLYNRSEIDAEEKMRKSLLNYAVNNDIQIYQLPCPEFSLYGSKRWGHVSEQFDNPFFREHCRKILSPFIQELSEYLSHPESFEVLGIVGIDGSPSCGVNFTCSGQWYGSFEERADLGEVVATCHSIDQPGIMFDELRKMLVEQQLENEVPISSLSELFQKLKL